MNSERSHAELECHHYREVGTNPSYRAMGMLDVEREWEAMNRPILDISDLEDRVGNLEEISAMPGQIPRRYSDQFQQLQGQVVFLQNTLNAALDKGKKKAEQRAKEQAIKKQGEKPTYRGLSAEDN